MADTRELSRKLEAKEIFPWKPFRELQEMRNLMASALEDFFGGNGHELRFDPFGGRSVSPAVDVEETDKEYIFKVELPGLDKDDFKVETQNGVLSINGERKEKKDEKGRHFIRHEQYYGAFRREFTMPGDANPEGIKASYKNGILTVTVPRLEGSKPKLISVSAGD